MTSSSPALLEEFQKNTNTENRYLIEFVDTSLECAIGWSKEFTRAVRDQSDIVPLLRELNKSGRSGILKAVYDLKAPINDGPQPVTLKPETLKAVENYYTERHLQRQRKDWDNQAWNFRLFSKRP